MSKANGVTEHKFQGVVGPFLRPGEHIELSAAAAIATPSVKREVATAAVVSIATLGTFSGYAVGRGVICVLTNERLLLFETNGNAKPVAKLMGEIGRRGLRFTPAGGVLSAKYDVVAPDGSTLRLTFAAIQKKAGRALVDAIAKTPPAKKAPAAKAPAKTVAAEKAPAAKSVAAKKTPAKKEAAKKAPTKKKTASSAKTRPITQR